MINDYNINGLAIPLFLIIMVMEYVFLRLKGRQLHRFNDSVTSLSMGILLLISDALLKAYTFAVFVYLFDNHRLFEFEYGTATTWLIFFFVLDLCYYCFHRCAHQINVLWGAHVGHHQSEEYNLTTALRQSAFQYAFSWLFYLPLAILGCPPGVFLVLFILLKLYQFWLHTRLINKIPLIEGILSTPSSHRVHHAKNPIYVDKNYGGTLVIWDRLFSSWQPELSGEPCHYGTTFPLASLNPVKANLQHWSMLASDTITTRAWLNKIKLWFKPTGWRPDDCQNKRTTTADVLQKTGCVNREKYNPKTSFGLNCYVALSMLTLFFLSFIYLFLVPTLSPWMLFLGASLIISGLVIAGELLENKRKYQPVEFIRFPLMLWFTFSLWFTPATTTIVNVISVDKSALEVLNYASTPVYWPNWHASSSKVYLDNNLPLQQGDEFKEDIQTPLGINRLNWQVITSKPGDIWLAQAINEDNKASISLEYRVKEQGNKTIFERTLNYTLPNVMLIAFNALYFKNKLVQKSQENLIEFKDSIENNEFFTEQ